MSCSITITNAYYDQSTGDMIVQGTAIGCPGPTVTVSISCGGSLTVPYNAAGIWNATLPNTCTCNLPVTISAYCTSTPACNATFIINNLCCCPTFTDSATPGNCNSSGQQLFTFNGTISINDSCTYVIPRDFGDGTFGILQTFTGTGTFPLASEMDHYNPGTYTSSINVVTPSAGCTNGQAPVTITATCGGSGCPPGSILSTFCVVLLSFFLMFGSIALIIPNFISSLTPCGTTLSLTNYATVAAVMLFLFTIFCGSCYCKYLLRIIAQLLIVEGLLYFLFVPPTVPPSAGCFAIFGNNASTLAGILIGSGILLLTIWYFLYKNTCQLTRCDFWCIIGGINPVNPSCTTIAIFAMLILWVSTSMVGLITPGFVVAVVAAIALSTISCVIRNIFLCTTNCNNC